MTWVPSWKINQQQRERRRNRKFPILHARWNRADYRLDDTTSKLKVLHAKQGRSRQFSTQAARDKFLNDEIKLLKGYEKTQQKLVENLTSDVEGAKTQLEELMASSQRQAREDADRRENLKNMGEEMSKLKGEVDAMQEQRKNLWREDGKLSQTVSNARTAMEDAQRSLQGMMDKVSQLILLEAMTADNAGYE